MRVDNPDDIDRMSFNLPIVKEMGDQVELYTIIQVLL